MDESNIFAIEGFFRAKTTCQDILVLDELILRTDISENEKSALIEQMIEEKVRGALNDE